MRSTALKHLPSLSSLPGRMSSSVRDGEAGGLGNGYTPSGDWRCPCDVWLSAAGRAASTRRLSFC